MKLADALVEVARSAGVALATHVPGSGARQVFAAWGGRGSYHEEVALGMALGSAMAGHPSICLIKMHGLLKAANALVCGLSAGVSAACVVLVFDDPGGGHSDNQLPTREMVEALEVPWLIAEESESALSSLQQALRESHERRLPYVLVLDSSLVDQEVERPRLSDRLEERSFFADPVGQLVCPLFGDYQRQRLLARRLLSPEPQAPDLPQLTAMPGHWQPTLEAYTPWVKAILSQAAVRPFVAGDTGLSSLFGLEPFRAVDVIGWMGGSVPLALGALAGGEPSAWAFTGDFSFVAAGQLGWLEARRWGLPLRVFLFDNGCARATGGQAVEPELLPQLLQGPEVVRVESPERLRLAADASVKGPRLYWFNVGGCS